MKGLEDNLARIKMFFIFIKQFKNELKSIESAELDFQSKKTLEFA